MSNSDLPLYKTAHFRRLREIIIEIGKYENIDISGYDLMKIKAYYVYGESLKGHNVSYNTDNNKSCWVSNNHYEFYEIPMKSNEPNSLYGNFMFFAYNKDFDYHLFGEMTVTLNKQSSIKVKQIIETVKFNNYGRYKITFSDSANILKTDIGSRFTPGTFSSDHTFGFDSFSERKKAYTTDTHKILSSLDKDFAKHTNQNKVNGTKPVKIYKKPNNNSNNRPNKNIVNGSSKSKKGK